MKGHPAEAIEQVWSEIDAAELLALRR
jgi:hypothetical protein